MSRPTIRCFFSPAERKDRGFGRNRKLSFAVPASRPEMRFYSPTSETASGSYGGAWMARNPCYGEQAGTNAAFSTVPPMTTPPLGLKMNRSITTLSAGCRAT